MTTISESRARLNKTNPLLRTRSSRSYESREVRNQRNERRKSVRNHGYGAGEGRAGFDSSEELFDDDRPSNRKSLFDIERVIRNTEARKKIGAERERVIRGGGEVVVPEILKSRAAKLAEDREEEEEEEVNEVDLVKYSTRDEYREEDDLVRKVVKGVDGMLDEVEKNQSENPFVKGTWGAFKTGEAFVKRPSVQKGARIVQRVGVETVKVATPIIAKGVTTGLKEGGKLAMKAAFGVKRAEGERREKIEMKRIVEEKSNGKQPTWKKTSSSNGDFFNNVFGQRKEIKEEEEEEEEPVRNNPSLLGNFFSKKTTPPPPISKPEKKKRTDIFGRVKE